MTDLLYATILLALVVLYLRVDVMHHFYKPMDLLVPFDEWAGAWSLSFDPIVGFVDVDPYPFDPNTPPSGNYSRVR